MSAIRPKIIGSIRAYADEGRPTGGFLRAVLSNDLKEAFGRADEENQAAMLEIVQYCYNEIPSVCWGSPEAVTSWLERKHKERETAVSTPVDKIREI